MKLTITAFGQEIKVSIKSHVDSLSPQYDEMKVYLYDFLPQNPKSKSNQETILG
jgi:hypothetical protein